MMGNLAQAAGPFAPGGSAALARSIVRSHGRSALDHFKLLPAKSLFFSEDHTAFLAYGAAPGVSVVLGDPVGQRSSFGPLLRSFLERFEGRGRSVVFLQIGGELLELYRALGHSPVRIGANARVDLDNLDMRSPRAKFLRHALRGLERAGLAVKHVEPPLPAALIARLAEANGSWLQLPGRFERGFSAGRFDARAIRLTPVSFVETSGGQVAAFVNWIPSPVPGEATVDLIRRRRDAPGCALDALMANVLLDARARGYRHFDLGLAPLARLSDGPILHPAERVERWIFRYGGRVFGQAGLYAWKAKFNPHWLTRWLAYRGGPLAFARAAWAVRRVVRGGVCKREA